MSEKIKEEVMKLIEPAILEEGFELVKVDYIPGQNGILRIYIDHEKGISIDDCANLSRILSDALDLHDPIKHNYNLEISSPGPKRPLIKKEHFVRFLGSYAKITLKEPIDDTKNITGKLYKLDQEILTVVTDDGKEYRISLNCIEQANLKAKSRQSF